MTIYRRNRRAVVAPIPLASARKAGPDAPLPPLPIAKVGAVISSIVAPHHYAGANKEHCPKIGEM